MADDILAEWEAQQAAQASPNASVSQYATEEDPSGWGEAIQQGVRNIPSSGWQYGKNLVSALVHPVETVKSIGNTIWGLGEKAVGTEVDTPEEAGRQAHADAIINYVKGRYGSEEGFKQAIATDPVGVMADFATIAMPAGKAVQGAGTLANAPTLANVGKKVAEVGASLEPTQMAVRAGVTAARAPYLVGKGASLLGEAGAQKAPFMAPVFDRVSKAGKKLEDITAAGPREMYLRAVKFGNLTPEEAEIAANIALREGIRPSTKGIKKLQGKIRDLNSKVDSIIAEKSRAGTSFAVDDILKPLDDEIAVGGRGHLPGDYKASLEKVRSQLTDKWQAKGGMLTPEDAQQLKKEIYSQLDTYYSKMSEAPASAEGGMLAAKGAREMIESIDPRIKALNLSEGALLELRDALFNPAARIGRRDLISFGTTTKTLAGAGLGGVPGAFGGAALGIATGPKTQAALAIILDNMRRNGMGNYPKTGAVMSAAAKPGQIEDAQYSPAPNPYIEPDPTKQQPAIFAPLL